MRKSGRLEARAESGDCGEQTGASEPLWVRRGTSIGTPRSAPDPWRDKDGVWTPDVTTRSRRGGRRGGDGDASGLEQVAELTLAERREHAIHLAWTRHATFGALILLVALLPGFSNTRAVALAGLSVSLFVLGLPFHRAGARTGTAPGIVPWLDAAVNVAMIAAAPALLPYGLVLGLGELALGVMIFGSVSSCFSAALIIVGYPVAAALHHHRIANDVTPLALFGAFVPPIAYLSAQLRRVDGLRRMKYADLLDGLDAIVWEANPVTLELTFVSQKAASILGFDPVDLLVEWESRVHPDDLETALARKRYAIREGGEASLVVTYRMIHRAGETIIVRDSMRIRRDRKGVAVQVRGVVTDVTFEQQAESTIQKHTQYDTLTRLPNRSLFNDELERRLANAVATNTGTIVLLLDLNGFKEVNDTLGHAIGDQLLQGIAGRLAAYLPPHSTIARLGGDEFAVALSPALLVEGEAVAETITASLTPGFSIDGMTIQAAASIGIARYPDHGDSPSALLRRADAAMYEAKRTGRNFVIATADDDAANLRRLELLGELRTAIVSGDFRLYHQPKIDVRSGRVVGTEGLIRWEHPRHGLLTPHHFVELSELSGLIQPLTRWVIEQGIGQLAEWRSQGMDITVAINMSVRNFFDHDLPDFIAGLLRDHGVPGDRLVLEITESEVMADRSLARHALHAFRSLGVKIAIDDFGTGFSSLTQLQLLPIDEIKVDQSFVRDMLNDEQDHVIVRSIIDLGHNLGLGVVVEGVEEERHLTALRQMGADRAQGYLIARPMPASQFVQWLHQYEQVRLNPGQAATPTPPAAPPKVPIIGRRAASGAHGSHPSQQAVRPEKAPTPSAIPAMRPSVPPAPTQPAHAGFRSVSATAPPVSAPVVSPPVVSPPVVSPPVVSPPVVSPPVVSIGAFEPSAVAGLVRTELSVGVGGIDTSIELPENWRSLVGS